jgi:uncharacterized protein
MIINSFKIQVSDSIGSVSAETVIPDKMKAIIVLAHGAGADMHHKFMKRVSEELAKVSIGTLRFNFPFMENKKGRPDVPPVAEKTVEAAVLQARELFPTVRLFAAGKSFGGRMTSHLLSKKKMDVVGVIFFGFPLHAPGKPSTERAAHLSSVSVPMLFLQGTRDTLASLELIKEVTSKLPTASLEVFDRADHSFAVGKKDVVDQLIVASSNWIKNLTSD